MRSFYAIRLCPKIFLISFLAQILRKLMPLVKDHFTSFGNIWSGAEPKILCLDMMCLSILSRGQRRMRPQVQLYLSLTLITLNPHLKATPDKHYSEARITSKYKRRLTNIHWEERIGCNKVMTNRLLLSNWYTLYWRFIVLVFYQSNRGPRGINLNRK